MTKMNRKNLDKWYIPVDKDSYREYEDNIRDEYGVEYGLYVVLPSM